MLKSLTTVNSPPIANIYPRNLRAGPSLEKEFARDALHQSLRVVGCAQKRSSLD
jgi:hypothetical protein